MKVFLSGSWVYGCVDFSSDIDYVVFSPEVLGGMRGKGGKGGEEVKEFAKKLATVLKGKKEEGEGEEKKEGEEKNVRQFCHVRALTSVPVPLVQVHSSPFSPTPRHLLSPF